MISYSEGHVFSKEAKKALKICEKFVQKTNGDFEIRCHELARACQHELYGEAGIRTTLVDGKYGAVDHSWLTIDKFILDVYAVGQLPQVKLVAQIPGLQFSGYYKSGPKRDDIRLNQVLALEAES